MAVLIRLFVALLLFAGLAPSLAIGSERAPSVSFSAIEGEPLQLDQLRGRVVVLDFWATWCPPCVAQLEALEQVRAKQPHADLIIVAASIDEDAEEARRYLAQKFPDAKFRVVHDPGGEALAKFGADGIPALFVIDREGIVQAAHSGPGGTDGLEELVAPLLAASPGLPPEPAAP